MVIRDNNLLLMQARGDQFGLMARAKYYQYSHQRAVDMYESLAIKYADLADKYAETIQKNHDMKVKIIKLVAS